VVSVYLDSSAYIKQFSQEKGSSSIRKIFEASETGRLVIIISQWTIGESLAAIDRKFRRKEIDKKEKEFSMIKLFEITVRLSQTGSLRMVPVREEIVRASWPLISMYSLSADDALHLVSAALGLASIFVAADEYLLKAAGKEGFETYNVENKDEEERLLEKLQLT